MNKNIRLFKFRPIGVNIGPKLFVTSLIALLAFVGCVVFGKSAIAGAVMYTLANTPPVVVIPEEEQEKLLKKIETKVQDLVTKAAEGKISKESLDSAVEKLNKEIKKLNDESIAQLKEAVDKITQKNEELNNAMIEQGKALKKLQDEGSMEKDKGDDAPKTFYDSLKEAFMANKNEILEEVTDSYGKRLSLKGFFEKKGSRAITPAMTLKAPVDMFQSNIVGNYVSYLRLTEVDPQRVSTPLTIYPHVMNVFMVKPISKPQMALLVVYEYENGAGVKAEGVAAAQSSFKLKTVSFPAFFISTYFNLSDETLDDLEEVMAEIALVAPDKLLDAIDAQILRAGGDDAASIKGIFHADKSTPYATALPANSIEGAYIVDVIASAKLQCENNKYRPNVVYMSPTTFTKLAAKKNSLNDSLSDKRVQYNNAGEAVVVCGLAIVKSTQVGNDEILVLDNRQPWIGRRRDLTMEIGYNGTDFVEGQKTVILKVRVAFGVRDKAGVIYVSGVEAAIAELLAA